MTIGGDRPDGGAAATELETDLCVIGAGSGGLSVAAGAVQMGARTVLIERDRMGGDCLNVGCVPSKALLAAANAAIAWTKAGSFGLATQAPEIDFARVHAHVHDVIAQIAPHDSVQRFEGLGVQVIKAEARFLDGRHVQAGPMRIRARRFVIATGSRPSLPPIPGLDTVRVETNETIFERTELPAHLLVVGGGPIGVELAQAFRRLGARVSLVEQAAILPRDDPELVDVVRHQLVADGIDLREGVAVHAVQPAGGAGTRVTALLADGTRLEASDLLIATGRTPAVDGLGLEAAGVRHGLAGIETDARLRTSNRRIFAIGDVAGGPAFTHVAGYHAGVAIKNILFRLPAKVRNRALPWVTYTMPELAHVGLTERAARDAHGSVRVLRWSFADNDRARAERCLTGLVKVVVRPDGRIVGASIVGRQAGELLAVWTLAISQNLKIGAVANLIAPYPTLGEVNKRAAGSYFVPMLFGERTRWIVRFLARFG